MRKLAGILLVLSLVLAGCGAKEPPAKAQGVGKSAVYEDLLALWRQFRDAQKPNIVAGVPDYTAKAMSAQRLRTGEFLARLAAIDPSGWPVGRQVDYHIVRAEMNGLELDHRVLKPWANNPAFYVTVFSSESDQPAREGPFALGSVELWQYTFPLHRESSGRIAAGLRPIPAVLEEAKTNLINHGCHTAVTAPRPIDRLSSGRAPH